MTYKFSGNVEIRTVGDSRGFLWRIIIDKQHGIGKLERISGVNDKSSKHPDVDVHGKVLQLKPGTDLHQDMENLTNVIESRFEAA